MEKQVKRAFIVSEKSTFNSNHFHVCNMSFYLAFEILSFVLRSLTVMCQDE